MHHDDASARVAARIRTLRRQSGHTMEGLALRAGIPPQTLGRIERGETSPTIRTVSKIASGLGVDVEALVAREGSVPLLSGGSIPERLLQPFAVLAPRSDPEIAWAARVLEVIFEGTDGREVRSHPLPAP